MYDGAVYMFQGRPYLCRKLNLGERVALVRPADVKYYTKTRDYTDVHVTGGRGGWELEGLWRAARQYYLDALPN